MKIIANIVLDLVLSLLSALVCILLIVMLCGCNDWPEAEKLPVDITHWNW